MMSQLKQWGFFSYGEVLPNLQIYGKAAPYPVLNERAIRAGAGMMFAAGGFAFFQAFYLADFIYIKVLVVLLFVDFFAKVVLGTKFSPISRLANIIVAKQTPEYVGAVQKRFAWGIGLILSAVMMGLIFGLGIIGPINLVICAICMVFMFMESAFGICVGCKIYSQLLARNLITPPAVRPACAGNVCAIE